jgi:hypothetical protein
MREAIITGIGTHPFYPPHESDVLTEWRVRRDEDIHVSIIMDELDGGTTLWMAPYSPPEIEGEWGEALTIPDSWLIRIDNAGAMSDERIAALVSAVLG